jgi:proteic killer suppression protein
MEVRHERSELDRLEKDPAFDDRRPPAVVKAFRKRMQFIRAASDERTFYSMKSLHYEKLKGDRAGQSSMRLNDQWRLILRLEGESPKTAVIIEIADYH